MRPNIILFNPDQFRADALGHLGCEASYTPVLDGLVEHDAVSFRFAACQNPVCTPSRCSFMSGWYPHVRGHRTMFHMMHEDEPVLLKTLKDDGYFVWWGGKNDLVPGQGTFDAFCTFKNSAEGVKLAPNPHASTAWRGEPGGKHWYSFYAGVAQGGENGDSYDSDLHNVVSACDFIQNQPHETPFCVYLPLGAPHPPYHAERKWIDKIDRSKLRKRLPTPDWTLKPGILKGIHSRQNLTSLTEDDWDDIRVTYLAMCARIDHQLGMVIDALKRSGQYDNTAIFFISDHGDFTGDYGLVEKTQNTFEDCLVHVPFIVKPPKNIPVKPRISEALIENIDLCATVEDLTGIPVRHTHFGRSLLPVIAGETDEHRDAVFCEGGRLRGEVQASEAQSLGIDETENLYWPRVGLQQQEGESFCHNKAVMLRTKRYKYVRRLEERDELYDLEADPGELDNRIDDPALREVLMALRDRLCGFYLETSDVVPMQTDAR